MTYMKVKVAHSGPAFPNPMDYTVHGIIQARILEWVAFPFSRGSLQPRDWTQASHMAGRFFTGWATREAQEYLKWVVYPFPGYLPNPGVKLRSPALQILYQLSYKGSHMIYIYTYICITKSLYYKYETEYCKTTIFQ